ncbi:flagellar hook-length control protein FliK [Paenibacillus cellulosilyticus]|uniref:Flagellar hook-length control protein FliK n=1 Tax=Paenibacillus cellulosilyticus TaxID=375489 RepID=A0A2V2YX51_9BACL|nr:flagellar hook-length control protein FliK [Paenibacillus cellulosilyticus]PWW06398.1 flagellar hook-length control protein FliK [Paenibacillus cellulosilyticus]QKS46255.1 flagellar hook-length control protein FliK [Paenibacillus cellulosilyticus]
MDMAIASTPTVPAAQTQSKTAANGTDSSAAAAGSSGQFGQKLAGSMKGQGGTSTAAAKTEASSTTAADQTAATTQVATVEQLTAEQLVAAIGELLQGLQNNADEQQSDDASTQDSQNMLDTLQQMLDQLNAMLTLLGQEPVQPLPQVPGFEVEDMKVDVAQALVQLQQTIESGQLGSAKLGNSLEWLNSQLTVLQQSVQQLKTGQNEQAAPQEDEQLLNIAPHTSSTSEQPTATTTQTTVTVKAVSLLDQLNRNTVSPNLLQVIAGQQQTSEHAEEPVVTADETPIAINLHAQAVEAARTTTVARTVQVPQQVPVEQFAEKMADLMVNKFEVKTAAGNSEAKLTLTPEHLGQVDVRISVQNGQLTALFVTDSSAAKDMLDNQLALLRANLQSQGLDVEKLEVSQQSVDSQMAQQQDGGSGRQQSGNSSGTSDNSESELSAFETELAEQTVIRGLGFGRGINVRA